MLQRSADEPILSEEQLQEFYREGYLLVPQLVSRATLERVLRAVPKDMHERVRDGQWTAQIFDFDDRLAHAAVHACLVEPKVIQAVECIFEAPARVFYGMLAAVGPNGGRGLPWHQDNMYTQIFGRALNAFCAVSPVKSNMASLWVAPKSHLNGTAPSRQSAEFGGHREALQEPSNGRCLPDLEPGDVCIFDRNLLHRSLRNESDSTRWAYAAQFIEDTARIAPEGRKDPKRLRAWELAKEFAPVVAA